jgi:dUTP pyrophosphatase
MGEYSKYSSGMENAPHAPHMDEHLIENAPPLEVYSKDLLKERESQSGIITPPPLPKVVSFPLLPINEKDDALVEGLVERMYNKCSCNVHPSLTAGIRVKNRNVILPVRAKETDIGYDIRATEDISIQLGEYVSINTGIIVKPPSGYHFEVILRSGAPKKYGVIIPNSVGLIDPSYCGPEDYVSVLLYKAFRVSSDVVITTGRETGPSVSTKILAGERIAQLILRKSYVFEWEDITDRPFDTVSRGGFGSTGK